MITVRAAQASDVPGIVRCAQRFPHYRVEREHAEAMALASISTGSCFVASLPSGTIVGFIVALVLPHAFSGRPYLDVYAWWVLPEWRKSGCALRLARHILRFQWTEPLELVKIAVADARIGAWLQRQGFHAVETVFVKGDAWQQRYRSSQPRSA